MGGYIANFTVYTMAMTGLICFAVFVYKKVVSGGFNSKNAKFLSIEDSMSLSPRKSIHVIRAGNEKFLIASDVDRTTLLAKLEWNKPLSDVNNSDRFRQISEPEQKNEDIIKKIINEENKKINEIYENPKPETTSEKIIHLEQVDPSRKRVGARHKMDSKIMVGEVKVQKRRMPEPEPTNSYRVEPRSFSPMKEMAKRINEL